MFGNNKYGDTTALIAQLRVEYADGSVVTTGTDGSWRTAHGPSLAADLLDGETYDARRPPIERLGPTGVRRFAGTRSSGRRRRTSSSRRPTSRSGSPSG